VSSSAACIERPVTKVCKCSQVNHAIGATSSMYHASCVTADAADADLIVVELTLNDYPGPEMDITQSPSKCAGRGRHHQNRWPHGFKSGPADSSRS